MNKILKYLLTGILTVATILTAFPSTQVYASEQVYTNAPDKAGTIVKIDNSGNTISTFIESIMNAGGETAYCIDINTDFKSGYKTRYDATEKMTQNQINDVALSLEYVKQYTDSHPELTSKQVYLLEQCMVWRRLSVHLGWGYDNVRADYSEVSEAIQNEVYTNAKTFVTQNKDRYECGGYVYIGEGQDLGQFWAKLAVGNATIKKSSTNTTITNDNDCYSLAGATYTVYSDKDYTKVVTTFTTDKSGNTDTVEVKAGTYYAKETVAPKGFQLDETVYSLTVSAGETVTLKVNDTPKVTTTLIDLFKIDMETGASTPQGNATLEGATFVWNYYDDYYTKDTLPTTPTKTWTTKTIAETDSDGAIRYVTGFTPMQTCISLTPKTVTWQTLKQFYPTSTIVKFFTNFLPAMGEKAKKAIREEVRGWKLQLKPDKDLWDIANMFNKQIQGWINYYTHFYKSEIYDTLRYINGCLVKWVRRKYKKRKARRRAEHWLGEIAKRERNLFAHWKFGILPAAG